MRNKVDKKMPWEEIQKKFPTVSQQDFKKFLENEDEGKMKDLRKWGREMRDKNLGNHRLGSRGYQGVQKKWKKQDEELRAAGKTNPYDKYDDPKAKAYIRLRYYFDKNGNLVMDSHRVRDLEATLLVRNLITSLLSFSNQVAPILNASLASRRNNKKEHPKHPPRHRRRPSRGTSLSKGR